MGKTYGGGETFAFLPQRFGGGISGRAVSETLLAGCPSEDSVALQQVSRGNYGMDGGYNGGEGGSPPDGGYPPRSEAHHLVQQERGWRAWGEGGGEHCCNLQADKASAERRKEGQKNQESHPPFLSPLNTEQGRSPKSSSASMGREPCDFTKGLTSPKAMPGVGVCMCIGQALCSWDHFPS
ncbi:hypothetical protein LZ30DRAFT_272846 [Colletotrichum cereale]|nr:hypothetical protein LZ30DRAFT_272846 [Colletotrichum cereale]